MLLYRPVGMHELRLIYKLRLRGFPARRPEQPIFYPVLNFGYAEQIARDWNTKSGDFAGYVTQFTVDDRYVSQFERHIVGGRQHEELWVPAEQLKEFNRHIQGPIKVMAAYFGPQFRGYIAERANLRGKDAREQFVVLVQIGSYSGFDFVGEIIANQLAVFLHYPFWLQHDFIDDGISTKQRQHVLEGIAEAWKGLVPALPRPQVKA